MDKLQQFISDNKSCPLTPMATKQLFIKFIEFLSKEGLGNLLNITYDEQGNLLHSDLPIEAEHTIIGDDIYLQNKLFVNNINSLVNKSNTPLIPITNNAGKFLSVNSLGTGLEAMLPSSLDLLGTAQINDIQSSLDVHAFFENVDLTKITSKTLLIFTYDNCFIMGMVGQTGIGKVAGLVRRGWSGTDDDYEISKVSFTLIPDQNAISVWTDTPAGFTSGTAPIAYLFALTIK